MNIIEFAKNTKTFNKNDVVKAMHTSLSFLETLNDPLREMKANDVSMEAILDRLGRLNLKRELLSPLPNGITAASVYAAAVSGGQLVIKACIQEMQSSRNNIIDGSTMTIRQANTLMISSAIDLWVDYTNRLMQYGMSAMLSDKPIKLDKPDESFFITNESFYVDVTRMLFEGSGIIIKRLKALPEMPVEESTVNVLESTKGKDAVLAMPVRNWAPHQFLPVYWINLGVMEFDLWRIKVHAQRIESNSMKIQQLQDKQLGDPSPANERAIQRYEDLIIKSQDRIESIQRSYDYNE